MATTRPGASRGSNCSRARDGRQRRMPVDPTHRNRSRASRRERWRRLSSGRDRGLASKRTLPIHRRRHRRPCPEAGPEKQTSTNPANATRQAGRTRAALAIPIPPTAQKLYCGRSTFKGHNLPETPLHPRLRKPAVAGASKPAEIHPAGPRPKSDHCLRRLWPESTCCGQFAASLKQFFAKIPRFDARAV